MKVIGVHCPYCGGNIKFDLDSGRKHCFCVHCGQQILLDDEVIRTEYREVKVDEARIKEADVQAQIELEKLKVYERDLERWEKKRGFRIILGIGWVVGVIVLVLFCIGFSNLTGDQISTFWLAFWGGVSWSILGIIFLCTSTAKPLSPDVSKIREELRKELFQSSQGSSLFDGNSDSNRRLFGEKYGK